MSYWSNDEKPPVKQTSHAISSKNGLSYSGGQRVEFEIPNTTELFDGRNSYLNFDVQLALPGAAGTMPTRLQLDSTLGGQTLIKNIRIFENGGSGKLLEEISDYNAKVGIQYSYDSDESLRNMRAMREGALTHTPDNRGNRGTSKSNLINTKYNPYYKSKTAPILATPWDNTDFLKAKCCLPLHTGIFADSIQAFPNFLFQNGLRVEIDLEEAPKVIKQLDSVNRFRRTPLNAQFSGVTNKVGGDPWLKNSKTDTIFLSILNNQISTGNCAFVVGERVNFCQSADQNVTAHLQDGAGAGYEHPKIADIRLDPAPPPGTQPKLRITFDQQYLNPNVALIVDIDDNYVMYSASIDTQTGAPSNQAALTSYDATYTLSNCELVLEALELGDKQRKEMMDNMRDGGAMELDILSCTNYKHSLVATNRQATINLPLSNTRAKSILCLPTDASVYNSAQLIAGLTTYVEETAVVGAGNLIMDTILQSNRSGYTGCIDHLTEYQWNIDDKLTPSRPVSVSKINLGRGISAQAITETDKALNQSRIVPRSFHDFNRNFVIGRAYALADGVTDLRNRTNQLQLSYNEVQGPAKNKLLMSFVYHIRRIVVKGDNVDVLL